MVETWEREFYEAPREQRLPFLYLANDILQNGKKKGSEFVTEFWKVLPGALRDVIENSEELARNSAFRLVRAPNSRWVGRREGFFLQI